MMLQTDPVHEFLRLVGIVESAGVALPREYLELKARFDSFAALDCPQLAKLTDAVMSGDTSADVEMLRAAAIAEKSLAPSIGQVVEHVRRQVFSQLRDIYSGVARANYAAIAAQFDQQAKVFMTGAKTTNVEADAADMIKTGSEKQRKAWLDAESHAHRLSELVEPLAAAASLAGVKIEDTARDTILLPLTVDTAGQHRRKVWTSWLHIDGRTQRWGSLAALGCTIRAADLDELQAYSELRPIEYRQTQIVGQPRGTYETTAHDPEDADYEPEPGPEMTMISRTAI
jgi:hypothetical protein